MLKNVLARMPGVGVRHAAVPLWQSYEGAVDWLLANRLPEGGLAVSSVVRHPYPEVTGYTIPTLLEAGERTLALDLATWLMRIQRPDGGFESHDGEAEPYLFDVGQVLRGLLAVRDVLPGAEESIRKAADWMIESVDPRGIVRPTPDSIWSRRYGPRISEDIHLYALPPLLEAGRVLGNRKYVDCVERSVDYYTAKPDLVRFKFLTHFYGYVLEALVDLDRQDLARTGMVEIAAIQRQDGGIPGEPGAVWVCSPGQAQLAIVGYKLGLTGFADAAVAYLQRVQLPSGGFFGSYGRGANYAPQEELSWACKYFLDACHWRIRTAFSNQQNRFQIQPDRADPRVEPVLGALGNCSGKRIVDVGCGRGKFLRVLQERYPTAELWGVDVSQELLDALPDGVQRRRASMVNLPFGDGTFDGVLCVEALEHAVRIQSAIAELCRVLKPGGKIVIVDKDIRFLGLMAIETWEKWFDQNSVAEMLNAYCSNVDIRSISLPVSGRSEAVLTLWEGRRATTTPLHGATERRTRPTPALVKYYQRSQRRAEASRLVSRAFEQYAAGDLAGTRLSCLRLLTIEPRYLLDRGVLSITVESVLGRAAAGFARATSRRIRSAMRASVNRSG